MATISHGHIAHQAILSFAAIFFGAQHRQAQITRIGFALYGMVLQRLNEALSDPAYNTHDDLIHAVVTLGILEIFVSSGAGNHLKHMAGLERLFALRGPNLALSCDSAEMYRSLRLMITFAALRSKKPTILAQPEWKTQLRAHIDSPEELQKQELFDVLADCTVVISARGWILCSSGMSPEKSALELDKLKQDAMALLAQLYAWRKRWDSNEEHKATETPLSPNELNKGQTDSEDDLLPFTTNLEYSNESLGIVVMLYDVSLIYVLQMLALLTSPPDSTYTSSAVTLPLDSSPTKDENFLHDPPHFPNLWSHPGPSAQPLNPYLSAQMVPILDICRTITYHLSSPQRASSSVLHWATATVWARVRGEESVIGRWVWKTLEERKSILLKTLKNLAG